MTLGHSRQPQGSLEMSKAPLSCSPQTFPTWDHILNAEILLQQHPCPSPPQEGSAGNIPTGSPCKIPSSLQPWEHAWV